MNILFTAAISLIASAVIFVGGMNLPASNFSLKSLSEPIFGAFTEISTATNLADFPTTYNANLNKTIEVGTTSIPTITTLAGLTSASSLATIGTITSGIWNGTVIGVAYNGTGTTSPTLDQIMLGNGASGFKVVSGFGNSGQFLTSGGAATAPTWTTSAIDQAANYTWTGGHIFDRATTTSATTTNLAFTGITSSLLRTDSTGRVLSATAGTHYEGAKYTFSTTTDAIVTGTTHATTTTFAIPAVLTASSTITVTVHGNCDDDVGGAACTFRLRNAAGSQFVQCSSSVAAGEAKDTSFNFTILANNSTSAQISYCEAFSESAVGFVMADSSSSIDLSSGLSLVGVWHTGVSSDAFTVKFMSVIVEP